MTFPKSAARRYARAIVEAARGKEDLRTLAADFQRFAAGLAQVPELGRALRSPALPVDRKTAIVNAILEAAGASKVVRMAVALVVQQGHAEGLTAVGEALVEEAAAAQGIIRATVRSAQPLQADAVARIAQALGQALGRPVEVETSVDPALIGGFVARAGDLVFDGSLSRQLERLRGTLTREEKR